MSEDTNPVEETEIPLEEDTIEETETTTQPDVDEAYVEEDEIESQDDINEKYQRVSGKVSKLEQDTVAYQQSLAKNQEWILKNESRTRDYLADEGLNPLEIENAVKLIKEKKPDIWNPKSETPADQPQVQSVDPIKIKEEIKRDMQMDQYVQTEREAFFQEVPEMSPENFKDASPEDKELVRDFANKVDFLANSLMQTQPITYSQALKQSYKTLLNTMGIEDDVKEQGRIEGMAEMLEDDSTTVGNQSSGMGSSVGTSLTDAEQEIISKLPNMDAKGYAKYKR